MEGGLTHSDVSLFLAEAEKAGINAVNVTGGWHETRMFPSSPPMSRRGPMPILARGIKDRVVFLLCLEPAGRSGDGREGPGGRCCRHDLRPRPLLADPKLPRKVKEGRVDEIIVCGLQSGLSSTASFPGTGVPVCSIHALAGRRN